MGIKTHAALQWEAVFAHTPLPDITSSSRHYSFICRMLGNPSDMLGRVQVAEAGGLSQLHFLERGCSFAGILKPGFPVLLRQGRAGALRGQ